MILDKHQSGVSVAPGAPTRSGWIRLMLAVALLTTGLIAGVSDRSGAVGVVQSISSPTNRGDTARDGWYPDQPLLNPSNVSSSKFGQIFSTPVVGQVYAQPIVASGTLVVATEQDWIYGLDPVSGAQRWSRQLGQPFPDVNWGCPDLAPYVGVTSTPTVDPSTGITYLVSMEQQNDGTLGYWMHAINPTTGAEMPNFPVQITGSATNDPQATFDANLELQRPGLLLLNNHVFAAFSSHCDDGAYQGFVAGVATSGGSSSLWTDVNGADAGGGIWQSGGGLVSDGANTILLTSGNGATSPSGTIAGNSPPASLGESVIRLDASDPEHLKAVDFFTPFDAAVLDGADLDFGSGAPVALPDSMGTTNDPHLLMQVGKEGYVYLLNRDNLGGVGTGVGGGDGAVAKVGPYGGAWATPAVWPGDGGWVYLPTATGGSSSLGNPNQGNLNAYRVDSTGATPTISLAATATDAFGFGSSSAIVTSNQTQSGSAVVWVVRTVSGSGVGATLQAYSATPTGTKLTLLGEWPVGQATKFNQPGVSGNRLYVGSQDGHIRGFGILSAPALSANTPVFSNTILGSAQIQTVTVNVAKSLHVTSVHTSSPQFSVSAVTPPIAVSGGLHVPAGGHFSVDVSFDPSGSVGGKLDTLAIVTDKGELDLTLSAAAVSPNPLLWESTAGISLGGVTIGSTASSSITLTNFGAKALHFTGVTQPSFPFTLVNPPVVGTVLPSGGSITVGGRVGGGALAGQARDHPGSDRAA